MWSGLSRAQDQIEQYPDEEVNLGWGQVALGQVRDETQCLDQFEEPLYPSQGFGVAVG